MGREDIIKEGNKFDKYALIDSWTYDRFVDARENFHPVTTRNLQQWALSAAGPKFDKDFVINTDQTGCQYQSTFNRTLAHKGSNTIFVKRDKT
ncbi:valine--tRNA ligase [Trichonephila inaurata madagascariensis]|uniref:Valine--tRNA ligase n=1 Tax=Trichonephila inaurata madagascariensis TaxID=2747483 RepID=A0A8X6YWF6_9ARAC|nr:valine--tRNA ligase [Trichonephila inaurata madagascariensis]